MTLDQLISKLTEWYSDTKSYNLDVKAKSFLIKEISMKPIKPTIQQQLDSLTSIVLTLVEKVDCLAQDIQAIKNCPTIKRELIIK